MSKKIHGLWKTTYGQVSQTLRVLEDLGITPEDLKRLRRDELFASRLVAFWKVGAVPGDCILDTRSQTIARSIMRKSFLGLEEVRRAYGVEYTEEQRNLLAEIPFTEEMLYRYRSSHVLVAGSALSLSDLSTMAGNDFYETDFLDNQDAFVREKKMSMRWYLMRKQPVTNSLYKTSDQQIALLTKEEEVPFACEVCYMVILYWRTHQQRLLRKVFVRCNDKDSDGFPVCVGYFDSDGLEVSDNASDENDNNHDDPVGLASCIIPEVLHPVS